MNKYCELCDNVATDYDMDMGMYLCRADYVSFNGATESIELDEVYDY